MIVVVALGLRAAVVVADNGYRPANDAFEYDYYARSIADGNGYPTSGYLLQRGPTAIRGPAYPYLLAGVYAITDDSRDGGRLANAVLGAMAVMLIYLLARRIWGRNVGLAAAALAAVFPPLVLLSRQLLSESLFIALELGAILCVLNFRRSGGLLRWAAAGGALCGLAALTRNSGFVVLIAVVLGVSLRPRLSGRALIAPALAILCAALVIAPWTVRNAVQFGRFIPVTTSTGISLSGTYNETSFLDKRAHGAWRDPQVVPEFRPLFVTPGIDEAAVDSTLRRKAADFAGKHPSYVAEASAWNLLRMFEIVGGSVVGAHGQVLSDGGIGSADPTLERIGLGVAAALAMVGLIAIVRSRPRGPLFLWLVPFLIVLTSAPVGGLPRYRLPADPFLLIAAALGLVWLSRLFSGRSSHSAR